MRSITGKIWAVIARMQIVVVFPAFALMIIISYYYMSSIERMHMVKETEEVLAFTEANIASDLQEPETLLGGIAETIRGMILQGGSFDAVLEYIKNITGYITSDEHLVSYATGVYGFFDVFDGRFAAGIDWTPGDDYVPADRPWYKAAVDAKGKVGYTDPYLNVSLGFVSITYARRIFDEENRPLGVVCLDIMLDRVKGYAVNTQIAEGGYGILVSRQMEVIAHPDGMQCGKALWDMDGEISTLADDLIQGRDITERRLINYKGEKTIVFFRQLENGWYMGVVTPESVYYRNKNKMAVTLTVLGTVLAFALSAILLNIVTAKKKTEERMRLIFDFMPLGANFHDRNYDFFDCNQSAINMFGLTDKQEYIEKFPELSPEYQPDGSLSKKKSLELIDKAFNEGHCCFEWTHMTVKGEPIPCEITLVRVVYNKEFALVAYMRDMREFITMQHEKRKAEIAEENNRAKSNFLARMSHEIRTPMNAVLGITEIQLQDETLAQDKREAFNRIFNSGSLLLNIINDILDISKIEAGKMELMPVKYEIASLINDTVQLNMKRYESKPITFMTQIDENIPSVLVGDEFRIKQILNNLLSNAFKYTRQGMINLSISAEPENGKESSKLTLIFRISDTGQGMTEEQVYKLGEEYFRFNTDVNRSIEGAGLGMNITRNLVQLMNGEIAVESVVGMGSTFTVRLPQESIGAAPLGKELAENLGLFRINSASKFENMQIQREPMPYGRVLVVDDVETNLYVAKGLLAPYELSIDTALSGFEAVDRILDGNVYDIVFMDHLMPKMDGIETLKIMRNLGYRYPVVVLTANALTGQAELFLNNGFDGFLSKPIDICQLDISLKKLIRDKQPPEVIEAVRQRALDEQDKKAALQTSVHPQLAEIFVRDARKAKAVLDAVYMNNCRRADDVSMFIINVHAMKSALANIGETELSAAASGLEQAGRENNIEQILAETPAFLESLDRVIEKYSPKEDEESDADAAVGDFDNAYLRERSIAIQTACAVYDKKAAKEALAELKQKTWPQTIKKRLDAVSEHLLHSEFEEAAKVAGENYFDN
jgi:signal transduction histidine kinase/CheY-like chemotaxis protein